MPRLHPNAPIKPRPSVQKNWPKCLKDNLRVFGATHGCTDEAPCVFGVPKFVWSEAAKVERGGV